MMLKLKEVNPNTIMINQCLNGYVAVLLDEHGVELGRAIISQYDMRGYSDSSMAQVIDRLFEIKAEPEADTVVDQVVDAIREAEL